jgi:transglutaminase-like putative cysteine protease
MQRREFFRRAGAAGAVGILDARALWAQALESGQWRTFEVTTHVEVLRPHGATRVWLPTPLAVAPYQKTMGDTYHAPAGSLVMIETTANEPDMLGAHWDEGAEPVLTLTSRVATRDLVVDLATPTVAPPPDLSGFGAFLRPTRLIPTDGIVKKTADEITKGAGTDIEKARAIYDWIVDHTFRDPAVAGCGTGDIRFMLESGSLGGKCADLNALFVGLARAAGLPARDVYGVRVAASRKEFRSLGLSSADASRAQHCRAEVYLVGYGWVPVDPADVRKVILEEPPGHLSPSDERVKTARARLFGSWEMNWIAYNFSHDVSLRGSARRPLGYFMYPQGETADGPIDSLNPDGFRYAITAIEI